MFKLYIISVIVISIIGTSSHFLYDISHHNKFIALFAAVNESTWEHTKICLTGLLAWGLVDGFIYGGNPNYFLAKSASLIAAIVIIPAIFYGYKSILKKDIVAIDITMFYIAIISAQAVFYFVLNLENISVFVQYSGNLLFYLIFGVYLILTLSPVHNKVFLDPVTNRYGVPGHPNMKNYYRRQKMAKSAKQIKSSK